MFSEALKGRHLFGLDLALTELPNAQRTCSQGCALGYHMLPFQGNVGIRFQVRVEIFGDRVFAPLALA